MTLVEARNRFRNQLSSLYAQAEIDHIFKRSIAHYFNWEGIKIGLTPELILHAEEEAILVEVVNSLADATPLQYILGETTFLGLILKVSPGVLIPRPETEELVSWVLDEQNNTPKKAFDLCCGAGCIALALAKQRPEWDITGVDFSEKALKVAEENASDNRIEVNWKKTNILNKKYQEAPTDLIISNPPYVLPSEKKQMHKNVLEHEPHEALFVPENDPLLFYKAILDIGRASFRSAGVIYFEINPLCVNDLLVLGEEKGFGNAKVKKDIFGKDRFVKFSYAK